MIEMVFYCDLVASPEYLSFIISCVFVCIFLECGRGKKPEAKSIFDKIYSFVYLKNLAFFITETTCCC